MFAMTGDASELKIKLKYLQEGQDLGPLGSKDSRALYVSIEYKFKKISPDVYEFDSDKKLIFRSKPIFQRNEPIQTQEFQNFDEIPNFKPVYMIPFGHIAHAFLKL